MNPAELVRTLDAELGRRDTRQAFLWTVAVSSLGAAVYLLGGIDKTVETMRNLPADGLGLAAVLLATVLLPLADRFLEVVHPSRGEPSNARAALDLTKYIHLHGIAPSLRFNYLPQALSLLLSAWWFWNLAGQHLAGGREIYSVLSIVFAIWALNTGGTLLIPNALYTPYLVSALSGMILAIYPDPESRRDASLLFMEAQAKNPLKKPPFASAPDASDVAGLNLAEWFVRRRKYFAAISLMAVVSHFALHSTSPQSDFFLLSASVALIVFAMRIAVTLYFDNTREMLEVLRARTITGPLSEVDFARAYELTHHIYQTKNFHRDPLRQVAQALSYVPNGYQTAILARDRVEADTSTSSQS